MSLFSKKVRGDSAVRYIPMNNNHGFVTDDSDTRVLVDATDSDGEMDVTSVRSIQGSYNGLPPSSPSLSPNSTHCHQMDWHRENTDRRAERVLWAVAFLSLLFICLEVVGGWFAHSLAIMSDAGHMVSDLISFLISIFAIRTARSAPTRRLSFGYARAEVLGACMSMVILWVITVVLVILAAQRIIDNKYDIEGDTMMYTAGAGVIFNIIMAFVLQCGGQGHNHSHHGISHDHSHSTDTSASSDSSASASSHRHTNVNVRAAFIHVIGDLIQSIGVLVSAFIVKYTEFQIADPICTFLFSVIVLFTSIPVLKEIGLLLMEAAPDHIDVTAMRKDLLGVEGVKGVHDMHIWALNMNKVAMSAHLAIDSADRAVHLTSDARALLQSKYNLQSITLQTELYEKNMSTCDGCTSMV